MPLPHISHSEVNIYLIGEYSCDVLLLLAGIIVAVMLQRY